MSNSDVNPQNTLSIPARPAGPTDRTGVVKIFVFPRSKSGIFDLKWNKIEHFKKALKFYFKNDTDYTALINTNN